MVKFTAEMAVVASLFFCTAGVSCVALETRTATPASVPTLTTIWASDKTSIVSIFLMCCRPSSVELSTASIALRLSSFVFACRDSRIACSIAACPPWIARAKKKTPTHATAAAPSAISAMRNERRLIRSKCPRKRHGERAVARSDQRAHRNIDRIEARVAVERGAIRLNKVRSLRVSTHDDFAGLPRRVAERIEAHACRFCRKDDLEDFARRGGRADLCIKLRDCRHGFAQGGHGGRRRCGCRFAFHLYVADDEREVARQERDIKQECAEKRDGRKNEEEARALHAKNSLLVFWQKDVGHGLCGA